MTGALDTSRNSPKHCLREGRQTDFGGQLHAQRFVENNALETLHGGLEDMRARGTGDGKVDVAVLHAQGYLVLCPGERKAYSLFARQQRAFREFPKDLRKFLCRELALAITQLR